jgi:hypothetical protein
MREGPLYAQHKVWQQDQAAQQQTGFLSNLYVYEPLKIENGPWSTVLDFLGGQAGKEGGKAIAAETGPMAPLAAVVLPQISQTIGSSAGHEIGNYIDNSDTVVGNVQTFLGEISDWRSWANVMDQWSSDQSDQ